MKLFKSGWSNTVTPTLPIITAMSLYKTNFSEKKNQENINTNIGAVNNPAPASATERNDNPPKWQKIAKVLNIALKNTFQLFSALKIV